MHRTCRPPTLQERDPGWLLLEGRRKSGMMHCSLLLFRTPTFLRIVLGGTRIDRTCAAAYAVGEDPAVSAASAGWDDATYVAWRHVLHYRDLYQQKLAYVRGYLDATGADRIEHYNSLAATLGFLVPTRDAAQYYDEGAAGRCSAYDPFNAISLAADVGWGGVVGGKGASGAQGQSAPLPNPPKW